MSYQLLQDQGFFLSHGESELINQVSMAYKRASYYTKLKDEMLVSLHKVEFSDDTVDLSCFCIEPYDFKTVEQESKRSL
jgi:hypothetical protein